jgi:YYY domain-containing protein
MTQLLDPSWWVSLADQIWPWWLACALLGVLALPLTVRVFEGLADRGAGLSIGVGIVGTTWAAWLLGHLGVPHGGVSIRAAGLLIAAASAAAWWRRPQRALAALRGSLVPFLASQLLFAAGFAYFCNVRSYLPWITFDIGLSGAEKLGNLMHLNSVMRASAMPPGDAWLLGEPTNYYYGGHLLVATLAKLTGTPSRFAFNLGLATIFALSLSMGFSLTYSMAVRRGPRVRRRGVPWHRGMAWGVLGGLAIALFGNLDAWRQLGKRDPSGVRQQLEWRLRTERDRTRDPARAEAIVRELADLQGASVDGLRWSAENLKQIDYWASSRAIRGGPPGAEPGTITEFPYFSAMLGDLHPHHMALPYTIAALAACLALLRRNAAQRARTERQWRARCGRAAIAMGVAIGAVFPVNIWDSIVLSVLYLLALVLSRRGVEADLRWRWAAFGALTAAFAWGLALVVNLGAAVPALGTPVLYLAAVAAVVAVPLTLAWKRPRLSPAHALRAGIGSGAALSALGGLAAGLVSVHGGAAPALYAALRDGVLFTAAAALAAILTLQLAGRRLAAWTATLAAYAAVGAVALLLAGPFLLSFKSPLEAQTPVLLTKLPPVPVAAGPAPAAPLLQRLWAASPINPFPAELRSELLDYLAHWGLFVLPIVAFILVSLVRAGRDAPRAAVSIGLGAAAIFLVSFFAMDRYPTGPLCLGLAFACVLLAARPRCRVDSAVLLFAATGLFWGWFVEALHFDDSYGGALERYNTPFKIFYPLWPMLAAAAVGALRRLSPRVRVTAWPALSVATSPGVLVMAVLSWLIAAQTLGTRTGALAAGVAIVAAVFLASVVQLGHRLLRRSFSTDAAGLAAGLLFTLPGLLYPFAATAVRTRSLFSEPIDGTWMEDPQGERVRDFYTRRSLDGLAWLGQTRRYTHDLPAIEWLLENGTRGSVVLEAPSHGAYSPEGRVASMTGLPTLVGWKHHENQWRGWAKAMPLHLQRRLFDELADQLPGLDLGAPLTREAELELYRTSLESRAALEDAVRRHLPQADRWTIAADADRVVAARQKTLSAVALTEKLAQRMADMLQAPSLDDSVKRLLRVYQVRYVFAGSLEHAAYGNAVDKFAQFPRVFVDADTAVYEVPAELRTPVER